MFFFFFLFIRNDSYIGMLIQSTISAAFKYNYKVQHLYIKGHNTTYFFFFFKNHCLKSLIYKLIKVG